MNSRSIPADWLPQYTYTDYARWEGQWELIYGFPYAMSPSPKRKHQAVESNLIAFLKSLLSKNREQCCAVYHGLDWILDENTVVCPDVMIVCGKFDEDFLRFPPTLAIEIASEATRLKDRNVKFKLYESAGVKYYIIADPERESIEIFNLKDNYYQQTESHRFKLSASCVIEPDLGAVWS